MTLNMAREMAALRQLSTAELREQYAKVFGEQARSRNKAFLIKRIAWRMQANAEGDLSQRARRRATELANDADLRLTAPAPQPSDERLPMPQAEIIREYKGQTIVVKVLASGFEYDNQEFKSLSAVAKAITGSHWSGHRFFGLQQGGAQ